MSVNRNLSSELLLSLPEGLYAPKDGLVINFFSWSSVALFIGATVLLFFNWKLSIALYFIGYLLRRFNTRYSVNRVISLITSDELFLSYFADAIKLGRIIIEDLKGNVYVVHDESGSSGKVSLEIQTKSKFIASLKTN